MSKILLGVVVFFCLCMVSFFVVESRYDKELRQQNAQLKEAVDQFGKQRAEEKKKLFDVLTSLYAEQKDTITKIIYPEQAKAEAELKTTASKKEAK